MRFSLVLATVGRTAEIPRLLDSVAGQTLRDIELIVADQNEDDRLVAVLERYRTAFPIVHLRTARGLSRARNAGVAAAHGAIVAFPDDDAWYPPNLLERVDALFAANPGAMGYTGLCTDGHGRISAGGDCRVATAVGRYNAWHCGVSASIFLRMALLRDIGLFDEKLGLGSGTPYQSGEETDLLLRAAERGHHIQFRPDLEVYHPLPDPAASRAAVLRTWSYGLGMGRVMRKHRYGAAWVLYTVARPMGGALASAASGRTNTALLRLARGLGRLQGWLARDGRDPTPPAWISARQ